jgi:Mn2+/Fe2+ NRAMP family transporter
MRNEKMMKEFVNRRIILVPALISATIIIGLNAYLLFSSVWEVPM